jgi:hypothetical protein
VTTDPQRKKNLGIGDRATDVLLPEMTFEALKELFLSNDFARTRPHRHTAEPVFDFIRAAQEEGPNIIQDFHESMTVRGGKRYAILADVCGFANTNGGTLYIGLTGDPKKPVIGVPEAEAAIPQLEKEFSNRISPPLQCNVDIQETGGKKILRVLVPRGYDPPYAVDDNKIYVRSEAETGLAVRDEIVELVLRGPRRNAAADEAPELFDRAAERGAGRLSPVHEMDETIAEPLLEEDDVTTAPRTGVEVVSVEDRNGGHYYNMRDLRNGNVVKNVTRTSARRLWHYAITSFAQLPADLSQANIQWQGNLGLISTHKQGKSIRYDLIQRGTDGYRYFFGVTEDGIHGAWKGLVGQEDD